ncbi:hypothetical protein C8J56DRAFT_1028133 [Mycena floridula]|nr:hypothetical protein C8J56DRAFT_1028133 [Mycena floridula]
MPLAIPCRSDRIWIIFSSPFIPEYAVAAPGAPKVTEEYFSRTALSIPALVSYATDVAGKLKVEEDKWRSRRYIRRWEGQKIAPVEFTALGYSNQWRMGNGPTNGMKKNDLRIHGQKTKEEKCDQKMEERKKTKLSQSPHPNLHRHRKHVFWYHVDPALDAKADECQRAKGIPSSIWLCKGE